MAIKTANVQVTSSAADVEAKSTTIMDQVARQLSFRRNQSTHFTHYLTWYAVVKNSER